MIAMSFAKNKDIKILQRIGDGVNRTIHKVLHLSSLCPSNFFHFTLYVDVIVSLFK